jgi:hypothetical protein
LNCGTGTMFSSFWAIEFVLRQIKEKSSVH